MTDKNWKEKKKHRSKNGKEQLFIGQKRGAVIHRSKLEGEKKTQIKRRKGTKTYGSKTGSSNSQIKIERGNKKTQIKKRKGGKIYRTKMGSSDSQIKIGRRKKHRSKNGKEQLFIGQKRGAVIHRSKLEGEKKTQIKKRKGGKIFR